MTREIQTKITDGLIRHSMIRLEEYLLVNHVLGSTIFPIKDQLPDLVKSALLDIRIGVAVRLAGPDGFLIELQRLG